jgi:hypothetical protein
MLELYRLERGGTQPIPVKQTSSMPRTRSYVLPGFFGVFFVTIVLVGLTYVTLSAMGRIQDEGVASRSTATPTTIVSTPTPLSTASPEGATNVPQIAASIRSDDEAGMDEKQDQDSDPAGPTPTRTPFIIPTLPPSPAGGTAPSAPTPTSSPTITPEAPIVIEVSVIPGSGPGSWLRVQTDGTIAYEQIMAPGEQQVFTAQRQVQIRAGNPTVVQVGVNGLQPEVLGQVPGEPVDWSWPPQ